MKIFKINKKQELEKWHIWFAWHPVTVKIMPDGHYKKVWLEKVMRCGVLTYGCPDVYWAWEYKEIKNK